MTDVANRVVLDGRVIRNVLKLMQE